MAKRELTKKIKAELNKLETRSLIPVVKIYEIAKKCNCDTYCVMSVARYGTII